MYWSSLWKGINLEKGTKEFPHHLYYAVHMHLLEHGQRKEVWSGQREKKVK